MKTKWVLGACAAIAIAGAVAFVMRRSTDRGDAAKTDTLDAPACVGDKACAIERATRLRTVAHDDDVTLVHDAMALAKAFAKDDCDAATELAGGIARVTIDRTKNPEIGKAVDDALLGQRGYCAGAATKTPTPLPPDATITLARRGCEGSCPVYVVTVRADGEVTYVGEEWVETKGKVVHRIAAARARELFDAFEHMSFESGPPPDSSDVEDLATVTLTLARGAKPQVLEDERPCFGNQSINGGTCYLELRVDEIAETSRWVTRRTGD